MTDDDTRDPVVPNHVAAQQAGFVGGVQRRRREIAAVRRDRGADGLDLGVAGDVMAGLRGFDTFADDRAAQHDG